MALRSTAGPLPALLWRVPGEILPRTASVFACLASRRRFSSKSTDLTQAEEVRRGKEWDMLSAAEDLSSPRDRKFGWDWYAWMVVVTLIPPAVAALVGEYGRYDMKRAEAALAERGRELAAKERALLPDAGPEAQAQLLAQVQRQLSDLQAEMDALKGRLPAAPAAAASSARAASTVSQPERSTGQASSSGGGGGAGEPVARRAEQASAAAGTGPSTSSQIEGRDGSAPDLAKSAAWPRTRQLWEQMVGAGSWWRKAGHTSGAADGAGAAAAGGGDESQKPAARGGEATTDIMTT